MGLRPLRSGNMEKLVLDGQALTLDEIGEVALAGRPVEVSAGALRRVAESRGLIEKILAAGETVYGVNTGFGKLADVRVPGDKLAELQINLVRSHAGGVGQPLSEAESRAMVLLRANVLAKGFSGVRPELLELLVAMVNAGVHPVIPEKGSVGASGDLAPLAHLALVVVGEGEAFYRGERIAGGEALRRAGLKAIQLTAKEGLALLNGTQAMTAVGALAVLRARRVVELCDVSGAMSLDSLMGTPAAFDPRIQKARPHAGQIAAAEHLCGCWRHRRFASRIESMTRGCRMRIACDACRRCMEQCAACWSMCGSAGDGGRIGDG